MATLSSDIVYLIAVELAARRDFGSLYSCAVASKVWASAGAISQLYQIYHLSPIAIDLDSVFSAEGQERESIYYKWLTLWRSLILSSYNATILPYHQHIRILDLRNLVHLLEDGFRGKAASFFFAGELAHLSKMTVPEVSKKRKLGPPRTKLDLRQIALSVAESISVTANKIEVVTEPVMPGMNLLREGLPTWVNRLENLQSLQLGDGTALLDEDMQDRLIATCPLLNKLEIYHWKNEPRADATLARFFQKLPENTLTVFQNQRDCGFGEESCKALARHGLSMVALNLAVDVEGMRGLRHLQPLTQLVTLSLENLATWRGTDCLDAEMQQDIISWFQTLEQLRDLSMLEFAVAPDLLLPAFQKSCLKLEQLSIFGHHSQRCLYTMRDHNDFHVALRTQTHLKYLLLAGESNGIGMSDLDNLSASIASLTQLQHLDLGKSSELFLDQHLVALCQLRDLEFLHVEGIYATQDPLVELGKLKKLKNLTLAGLTGFEYSTYKTFVDGLGEGNRGLVFDVINPYWDGRMTEPEQDNILVDIVKKVGGNFFYQPKDPDEAQFGSDSDSD